MLSRTAEQTTLTETQTTWRTTAAQSSTSSRTSASETERSEVTLTTASVSSKSSSATTTTSATAASSSETSSQTSSTQSTVMTDSETTDTTLTTEEPRSFLLSAAQERVLQRSVLIGDALLSGHLPAGLDAELTAEGVGAYNAFETVFELDGQTCGVLDALRGRSPEYVICALGLEDLRSGLDEETFLAHYRVLLEQVQEAAPQAVIFAVSLAPAGAETGLNAQIDHYNSALHSMLADVPDWHWIDITPELRGAEHALMPEFAGADGLHLTGAGAQPYLWQLTEQMLEYTDLGAETEQLSE